MTNQLQLTPEMFARFKAGDKRLEELLYKCYQPICYLLAFRITGDRETAINVFNDAFIVLLKMRQRFETSADTIAFLYVCCRHAAVDALRIGKRSIEYMLLDDLLGYEDSAHNALEKLENTELVAFLYQEVAKLPPKRKAIMYFVLQGMNDYSIARSLQMRWSTVRSAKRAAISALRKRFVQMKGLFPEYAPFIQERTA